MHGSCSLQLKVGRRNLHRDIFNRLHGQQQYSIDVLIPCMQCKSHSPYSTVCLLSKTEVFHVKTSPSEIMSASREDASGTASSTSQTETLRKALGDLQQAIAQLPAGADFYVRAAYNKISRDFLIILTV